MEKSGLIAIIVTVLILGVIGIFVMSNLKNTPASDLINIPTSASPTQTATPKAGLEGDAPIVTKVYDVLIKDFAFTPAEITINAGETVNWRNKDTANHAIISDTGNELGSTTIATEGTYSHKFLNPGTYNYHCSIHSSMKGTVVVQ